MILQIEKNSPVFSFAGESGCLLCSWVDETFHFLRILLSMTSQGKNMTKSLWKQLFSLKLSTTVLHSEMQLHSLLSTSLFLPKKYFLWNVLTWHQKHLAVVQQDNVKKKSWNWSFVPLFAVLRLVAWFDVLHLHNISKGRQQAVMYADSFFLPKKHFSLR